MEKIYVGKVSNTHGIKGELRILSNFEYPQKAFLENTKLIIDDKTYTITSYRVHKNFHMVKFIGYDNINDVLFLKGKRVYKDKEELNLDADEVLDSDLKKFKVLTTDQKFGTIKEIFYASRNNKILRIDIEGKEVLIPFNSPCLQKIDKDKEIIEIKLIEGM